MTTFYDQFGRKRKLEHLRAVERLEELKQKNGTNPWPVIEECFRIWESTNPKAWQAHLVNIYDLRRTRKDSKFASSKDPVTGGILRYTLDIPEKVMYMIRMLYSVEELPMDRPFFLEFARRFPKLKVAQKV